MVMLFKFIREDGQELEMKRGGDYQILSVTGLETPVYTIFSNPSITDGNIYKSTRIEPREIEITLDISKYQNEDEKRNYLISFFNPKLQGILYVTRNNNIKKINYNVSSLKTNSTNMRDWQTFNLVLFCASSFFESLNNINYNYEKIINQFTFPFCITSNTTGVIGYQNIIGYISAENTFYINNEGDFETGFICYFKASGGTVTNPNFIINGEEVLFNVQLQDGQELIYNTKTGEKTITIDGEQYISVLDRSSGFEQLKKGINEITIYADHGYEYLLFNLTYNNLYLGV